MKLKKHKHVVNSLPWYGEFKVTVIPHVGKDKRKQIHLWDTTHRRHRSVIFDGDLDCPCGDIF